LIQRKDSSQFRDKGGRRESRQRRDNRSMEEFYPGIRAVHIGCAIVSVSLLMLRSVGYNLFDARWPMVFALRAIVWSVDTVLLTAAFMLMTITQQFPFATEWLTVKVLLLVVYVFLAWTAFRASGKRLRIAATLSAVLVFGFVYSIARAHDPLGIIA
jgi:uncharacterized membrane protein SirB2